jgi:hypothetical protein
MERRFALAAPLRYALRRFAGNAKAVGFYKTLQIENACYMGRYWKEASPQKAGVGGSIPSLATT